MSLDDSSLVLKRLLLERGSVFKMTLFRKDGIVPKGGNSISRDKYFVVVGVHHNKIKVGAVVINTDINIKIFHRIAPYQHLLSEKVYHFLNGKDRYVDCYNLFEFDCDRILEHADHIGIIEEQDMIHITEKIRESPNIRKAERQQYGI